MVIPTVPNSTVCREGNHRLNGGVNCSVDVAISDAQVRTEVEHSPTFDRPTLESLVSDLVQQIRTHYPDRLTLRPAAVRRRIVRLIDIGLLPFSRPSGRPRLQKVNNAVEMYRRHIEAVRRGDLKRVNWNAIALECIPGFAKIRTEPSRRDELKRLRDAVHARLRRKRRKVGTSPVPPT